MYKTPGKVLTASITENNSTWKMLVCFWNGSESDELSVSNSTALQRQLFAGLWQ